MSNEKIKEFYAKLETIAEFKKNVENLKLHRSEDLSEGCIRKIVSEIILPWDKKLGYNFWEAELLEFEKTQASVTKEKLNTEDLENVSGGINLTALLMAALSFISPVNTLGTTDAALANRQEALTMNPTLPTDITTETLPIEYPKDESSRLDEPEQYLQDDGSRSEENIEKVEFSVEEAMSHDNFLKIIDDSKEVNATAVFLHNTMETNGTWALSTAEIEEAAQSAQTTTTTKNALPKEVQDSLNMLKILPTDKEGLKPYLAIEENKFKDYMEKSFSEFYRNPEKAVDKFCKRTPNDYNDARKEPRNISRETVLEVKKNLLLELNKKYPQILGTPVEEQYLEKQLNKFKAQVSDYDRAKVVHDWVAENIAYNYADTSNGPEECEGTFRNHAEQVFKNKMGVCRGYAHLTELMMRAVGIPCVYLVSDNHAYNAIFIHGKWFLIDTTWDAYKETNKHLIGFSRKNATKNYKVDQKYNQVTSDWNGHIIHDYFPSNQDTAEGYNKKFITGSKSHEVHGATFHFDGERGVCEIKMKPSTDGTMVVWDATRECIVDGNLKLPDKIQKQAKMLIIDDKKVLNKIKKLYIPENIKLCDELETNLKNMDAVTVVLGNPYYAASKGILWRKGKGVISKRDILKLSSKQVHLPADFPYIKDPGDVFVNVKEITVDKNNPNYIIFAPDLFGKPGLYRRGTHRYPLWKKPD